ncbi:hypothetical protein [Helicobacter suis]|uniref:hypothetical protein n=1 Tax=Helicobacter suis TaxID=104628 RepID=UPI000CF0D57D|nr:hypothetical protein [Helicobacter suis]
MANQQGKMVGGFLKVPFSDAEKQLWYHLDHLQKLVKSQPQNKASLNNLRELLNIPIGEAFDIQDEEDYLFFLFSSLFDGHTLKPSEIYKMRTPPQSQFLLKGFKRGTCGLLSSSGGSGKSFFS